ncbi:unnamed protein product [Echinostoma caproni]|uniref:phosphatidylinositol N-acetylglucosaminyltransferase n=1 Tax=Echinostoma caproni TaxID=27848 RepID=A0A183A749_9TREM|nr:unnamed protein product [Echinostoma caproni]
MACDFFYPNVGGVETHIYALSQCLIARGHRVVVITHSYGPKGRQRQGIRYMSHGLKVYYIPFLPIYRETILLTVYGTLPIIREILIREQIDILHGHSSFSDLGSEAILHAQGMGIPTILTDHSLFGFADFTAVFMNKILTGVLGQIDSVICVSHTGKENTVLRAGLDPERVYVIPNAIDTSAFLPNPSARDLRFGGDGPKRLDLEEMRERYQLHSRVKFVGSLKPQEVRDLLVQGDIFLNTSLTEAFCVALLEAVSCGLLVVSTAVGGVPEVLPSEYVRLAPARAPEMAVSVANAVVEILQQRSQSDALCTTDDPGNVVSACTEDSVIASSDQRVRKMHEWVRAAYSWPQVAERTEVVYYSAMARERADFNSMLKKYYTEIGGAYGFTLCFLAQIHRFLLHLASWFRPAHYPLVESSKYSEPHISGGYQHMLTYTTSLSNPNPTDAALASPTSA